ncbi:hypothetical protein [Gluconobacter oxydans]|uniref:hypothetical protein n=1 Tax=Gluconobacter oxydans TaxID=442 RepID=UPI0039EBFCD0
MMVFDRPSDRMRIASDLTDKELKNLKPTAKLYKVTDRDGMYAAVTPTGVVSLSPRRWI